MAFSRHLLVAFFALLCTTSVATAAGDVDVSHLWGTWELVWFDNSQISRFPEQPRIEFARSGVYRAKMVIVERDHREELEATGNYYLEGAILWISTEEEGFMPAFRVAIDGWDLILEPLQLKAEHQLSFRLRRTL